MRLAALIILGVIPMLLSACQTSHEEEMPGGAATNVSSIPWNKPASWEGAGALGGFMPQGGH
jgi:hypothetical protein